MAQTTPNHTQTVTGWAAHDPSGKIVPYTFKRRAGHGGYVVMIFLSTNAQQMEAEKRSLDFILDTISAKHYVGAYLELLKVNGPLVIVVAPDQPIDLPSFPLIFGKRVIKGSMTGSIKETQEMLDFCGKYNVTCDIEIVTPDKINEALDRLAKNDVKYRFVIDIAGKSSSL